MELSMCQPYGLEDNLVDWMNMFGANIYIVLKSDSPFLFFCYGI